MYGKSKIMKHKGVFAYVCAPFNGTKIRSLWTLLQIIKKQKKSSYPHQIQHTHIPNTFFCSGVCVCVLFVYFFIFGIFPPKTSVTISTNKNLEHPVNSQHKKMDICCSFSNPQSSMQNNKPPSLVSNSLPEQILTSLFEFLDVGEHIVGFLRASDCVRVSSTSTQLKALIEKLPDNSLPKTTAFMLREQLFEWRTNHAPKIQRQSCFEVVHVASEVSKCVVSPMTTRWFTKWSTATERLFCEANTPTFMFNSFPVIETIPWVTELCVLDTMFMCDELLARFPSIRQIEFRNNAEYAYKDGSRIPQQVHTVTGHSMLLNNLSANVHSFVCTDQLFGLIPKTILSLELCKGAVHFTQQDGHILDTLETWDTRCFVHFGKGTLVTRTLIVNSSIPFPVQKDDFKGVCARAFCVDVLKRVCLVHICKRSRFLLKAYSCPEVELREFGCDMWQHIPITAKKLVIHAQPGWDAAFNMQQNKLEINDCLMVALGLIPRFIQTVVIVGLGTFRFPFDSIETHVASADCTIYFARNERFKCSRRCKWQGWKKQTATKRFK